MILSHERKFIFIKTPKTAGTSVEIALSQFCGPRDIITPITPSDEDVRRRLGFRTQQNYRASLLQRVSNRALSLAGVEPTHTGFRNHASAAEIKRQIQPQVWERYFKFSIVRNPFTRTISAYFWRKQMSEARGEPFNVSFSDYLAADPTMVTSISRVTHLNGKPAADFYIRFEHFEEDLATVADRLGLPQNPYMVMRSIKAKSGVRPPSADPASMFAGLPYTIELVRTSCAWEIETFGYPVPSA